MYAEAAFVGLPVLVGLFVGVLVLFSFRCLALSCPCVVAFMLGGWHAHLLPLFCFALLLIAWLAHLLSRWLLSFGMFACWDGWL